FTSADAVDLDRRHRELALGVLALEGLDQSDAVEDERARQVDGVDAAALAGAVDARRAGAEGGGHRLRVIGSPHPARPLRGRADLPTGGEENLAGAAGQSGEDRRDRGVVTQATGVEVEVVVRGKRAVVPVQLPDVRRAVLSRL